MTRCPECGSSNIGEDVPLDMMDDSGVATWTSTDQRCDTDTDRSYECSVCGCRWTETVTTSKKVEVHRHGRKEDGAILAAVREGGEAEGQEGLTQEGKQDSRA